MARYRQRGAVLVVSLLLLTVLTMLVIATVNTGTINLRIVDNFRSQQEAEAFTQVAVNDFLSDIQNFETPPTSDTEYNIDGHTVMVGAPDCVNTRPADGYSAKWGLTPEDTTWEFDATMTDGAGGAQATIRQGVEIRMPADSCP